MTAATFTVYIARRRSDGAFKIGMSRDVARRVGSLRWQFGEAFDLVATVPGGGVVERDLHARLAPYAIDGQSEMFTPSAAVLAVVHGLTRTKPAPAGDTIADRIRARIDELGISCRELSKRCGLAPTQVSMVLERLDRDPLAVELRTLDAIAHGAGVSMAWLLFGKEIW